VCTVGDIKWCADVWVTEWCKGLVGLGNVQLERDRVTGYWVTEWCKGLVRVDLLVWCDWGLCS
jgi:hypothetical protein